MLPPELDPALPAAEAAVDTAAVADAFLRCWQGPGPAPSVRECAPAYVRWWPGAELVATFTLKLEAPSPPGATLISVSVRPEGTRYALLAADIGLDGLSRATDPTAMTPVLRDALRRDIPACAITPVRYRPMRRCVLRFDVAPDAASESVYGKVLRATEATALAVTLPLLGDMVAPVLATVPQWGLIIQASTGGDSLNRVGKSAATHSDLEMVAGAARLLARLHGASIDAASRTLQDDAHSLLEFAPACERFAPGVAARLRDAAGRVGSFPSSDDLVPSHGAFRLDQVHITQRGPVLIDVDSFCASERERDLGNLFAYLCWRAIRRPDAGDAVDSVRTQFLSAYERAASRRVDAERLRLYEAVSLLKIAGRRYPRLKTAEWPLVPQLIDAAITLLAPAPVAR
ncbi:MAG: hypothetical protein JOZ46_12285 [Candidatus Dormibacteraeota bacterium]|nr:hypothetical protein [Candidatus Dormibacteraeota bacterium]MBV9526579.1 hypothetical protein [Candidatus Dormibacteraeota bacterium]